MRKWLLGFGSIALLGHSFGKTSTSQLEEYCSRISQDITIGMRKVDQTPEEFIRENPKVQAVINGIYFDKNSKLEGMAYFAENHHFAIEKPEHIRGYFSVDKTGNNILVSEKLVENLNDYWLVLGTHPLLVMNGEVHNQSNEMRYIGSAYRSAIGIKNGNICFAVSEDKISMSEWGGILKNSGYQGAINLDGGPISQMAVRNKDQIVVQGGGTQNTKLVVFFYNR